MPDDEVGAVVEDRLEHPADLGRVVLPVAVDLDGDLEAVVERVLVAGLDGPADPDVERQVYNGNSGRRSNARGRRPSSRR